ncbi:MAG: atp-dependent dna helicase pif1 [Lasallia pustulata]|uniref:ATP-dependent DNA helicase n=1 Tax=Lasallia pustulata TaxID=136370 RepID=A0A5M8PIE1_9LECA|nr:MAG: atp-dependent dna helicase pif1 [Lasallia pustulata]
MHEEQPPVINLSIYLPGQQIVYFDLDLSAAEVQDKMDRTFTTLMAFFDYNCNNTDGRNFLNQDFPVHYVFDGKLQRWHIRKWGTTIGRIYHCHPFGGEKYYLQLLLTVVRGPQSFEHLRTVNGLIYSTFQTACLARGLLQDNNEWILCFTEAVQFSSRYSLRALFVMALIHGDITNPQQIWNQFQEQFYDDLLHRLWQQSILPSQVVDPHLDYGLYLIQDVLADYDKTLADYQLPSFLYNWACGAGNPLIAAELEYNQPQEAALAAERCLQLNTGQKRCFDIITAAVADGPQHAHFFIQGSAGTGKTFLYQTLCNHYRALGTIVICVASSGIAALLLPGGQTSHSQFHIPLDVHEWSSCSITKNSQLALVSRPPITSTPTPSSAQLSVTTTITIDTIIIDTITIDVANISAVSVFTAVNIPRVLDFSSAAAAGNGGDPPLPSKPVGLWAQCNEEGAGSELTGEFVVVDTTTRKRKGNGVRKEPVRRSKRARRLLLDDASDRGDSCPEWCRGNDNLPARMQQARRHGRAIWAQPNQPPASATLDSGSPGVVAAPAATYGGSGGMGTRSQPSTQPSPPRPLPATTGTLRAPRCRSSTPEELVAAMAVLPESTAHALRILNAHQSCRRHENIEFNEWRRIEEMGSEASSDGEDGLGTAGEE